MRRRVPLCLARVIRITIMAAMQAASAAPHTPWNYVWPMSLIVQYRTATGAEEKNQIVRELALSNAGDGALHESFDVNDPRRYTRPSSAGLTRCSSRPSSNKPTPM